MIVARLGGWLEVASEKEVTDWIVLKNTDLRAGETWLLHVSRAARRVRALVWAQENVYEFHLGEKKIFAHLTNLLIQEYGVLDFL